QMCDCTSGNLEIPRCAIASEVLVLHHPGMTIAKLARGPACWAEPLIFRYQPACKPGFVGHRLLAQTIRDGHSSGTTFARCLEQPTRTASLTSPCGVIALSSEHSRVAVPIRSCSRCGLPCRFRCRTRGALLPHLFTLTAPPFRMGSGSFSVALSLGLPPPDVIRHRMSMEPGLSSPATFRCLPERPSGRLTPFVMGA